MNLTSSTDISNQIISKAKALGASLAGIANIELLKNSPSGEVYNINHHISMGTKGLSGKQRPGLWWY